jgi:hypothetical protein
MGMKRGRLVAVTGRLCRLSYKHLADAFATIGASASIGSVEKSNLRTPHAAK